MSASPRSAATSTPVASPSVRRPNRSHTGLATVYVVQGILGRTVAVLVDGRQVLDAVPGTSIVGPLFLTPGAHVVVLRQAAAVVVDARFTVPAGQSVDLVAHLSADEAHTPVVTVFRNDTAGVPPGRLRFVVSHVAAAPAADIHIDRKAYFRNVANGESLSLVLPATSYQLALTPTAIAGPPILAPVSVELAAGTLTRVFAVGDATAHTVEAIVQVLPVPIVGAPRPSSVHTGDGGQAADAVVDGSRSHRDVPIGVCVAVVGLAVVCRGVGRVVTVRRRA